MEQVKDIITDSKFNDFLQGQINAYNNRPLPGEGLSYRRTPFDGLKDKGKFNVESTRAEFTNRESNLSRAKRDVITQIVFEAARQNGKFPGKGSKNSRAGKTGNYRVEKLKKRTKKAK
jgi:hypothetical protein